MGDLNIHFSNPSDPCTAALNVVLGSLSKLVWNNVPTHCCIHTLDLLIMKRATDVLDLTVADTFLSDHLVISLDLLLRKKVMSHNINSVDIYMHAFRTDVHNICKSATQSDSPDPLSVYNTCLHQLLDHYVTCYLHSYRPYICTLGNSRNETGHGRAASSGTKMVWASAVWCQTW